MTDPNRKTAAVIYNPIKVDLDSLKSAVAHEDLAGEQKSDGDLQYDTASSFTARFSRPEQIELDGDGFGEAVAFRAWVEAGALRVRSVAAQALTGMASSSSRSAPASAGSAVWPTRKKSA